MASRAFTLLALCSGLILVALAPASASVAANPYPLLEVTGDEHHLGSSDNLDFNMIYLGAGGEAQRIVITTPRSFGASVVQAPGAKLGDAGLGLLRLGGGGTIADYTGSLISMNASAYASDADAQACDPGTHTATWELNVNNVRAGVVNLPIAVDKRAKGYSLTMCFGAEHTLGKQAEYVYFNADDMFRTPTEHGRYLFDAEVTPATTDGSPNPAATYELRAYAPLPVNVSAAPQYAASTKTLTVSGTASIDGRFDTDGTIEVYASKSKAFPQWVKIGETTTGAKGAYSFSRRYARLGYQTAFAYLDESDSRGCNGPSPAPGGCASMSTDGAGSESEPIKKLA